MRNFTSVFRVLCMAVLALVGVHVSAQENVTLAGAAVPVVGQQTISVPTAAATGYAGDIYSFDVDAVCEALSIESITEAQPFMLNVTTGEAVENTSDGWRDVNGDLATWGSGEGMVCVKINEPEKGIIDYIGAIDDTHAAGTNYTAKWVFIAGEKAYIVNIDLYFVADPTVIMIGEEAVNVVATQTVPVEVIEKTAYSGDQAQFDVAAVCEALGIGSITEAAQYIVDPFTLAATTNSTDGWRDPVGAPANWGSSAYMVCVKINEPESGIIDYIGTIADNYVENMAYNAYWAFVAGGKAAIVKTAISFVVDPSSLIQVPETVTSLAAINVVGGTECSSERYSTNGYETSPVAVSAADMAEKLGVSKSDLAQVFASQVYVTGVDSISCVGDYLQPLTVTDGWLIQGVLNFDGAAGDPLDELVAAPYGGNSIYFIHEMAYNAETDSVTFVVGQYPGTLHTGDAYYTRLHIMWGDKAYVIKYTMNIVDAPYDGFEDMTEVAVIDVHKEMYPATSYDPVTIAVDVETAAEALGCDVASLSLKALAANGGFSSQTTANNGGWWFSKAGYVCSYGSGEDGSYFFIEPAQSGDYSVLNMGQYPGNYQVGDSAVTDLFLVSGTKYIRLHVHLDIIEKIESDDWTRWESVANRSFVIQQAANDGYAWSEKVVSLTSEELGNLIGTDSPTLYALLDPATLGDGAMPYTDEYTMGEKPGFWLDANGYKTNWGSAEASPWGITCQAGATGITDGIGFKTIQFPGAGVVGNSFSGKFFLLNPETEKMITINLTCKIVESIADQEIVGEATIVVPVTVAGADVDFDLTPVAEALGLSVDDLMNGNYLHGASGAAVPPSTGLTFNLQGDVSEDDGAFGLVFDNSDAMYVYSNLTSEMEEGWKISTDIYFENEGKIYVVHITFMDKAGYDGIDAIHTAQQSAIYDLLGRRIQKVQRGIYIQNGHKVIK